MMSPRILQIFYSTNTDPEEQKHYTFNLELVKTQSSSEQRAFLSQTVPTISTYDWTELYAGLEPTDQSELIDELIHVFLEETSNVDVDSSSGSSKKHTALRKILVPLVNAHDHIELLTRLIENQYFQSDKEFATVYAKVWTVDPALSGKQACLHITADPRRAYHSTQRKQILHCLRLHQRLPVRRCRFRRC